MGKLSGTKNAIADIISDGDTVIGAWMLGMGTMLTFAGLSYLPSPDYTLSENLLRTFVSGSGLTSGSACIYIPISETIKDYRRLPDEHKPHKIIQRKAKNLYYRMRGRELE
jgi:hypothetical protein